MSSDPRDTPVLLPFATEWDLREFEGRSTPGEGPPVRLLEPRDADVRFDFDVERFVAEVSATYPGARGVFASSDYPGAPVAALIARRLGLAGPDPRAVLRTAHKYAARVALCAAVPEAVPRFALLDPFDPGTWHPGLDFPCFVKPVKGSFSVLARQVDTPQGLLDFLGTEPLREYCRYFVRIFDDLVRRHGVFERGAAFFLAEELLHGDQVTVEGWVQEGELGFLGIVDTHFHPGTKSFARFEYPCAYPQGVQARMRDVVGRAVRALGLDHTLFNVELMVDGRSDRIAVVEVNPRMCGQFADLYAKVDGIGGYEWARAIALGERPRPTPGGGTFAVAASVPLRAFERMRVRAVPSPDEIAELEREFPGTRIWLECRAGEVLCTAPEAEDGVSQRYAVANLGAGSRLALLDKARLIEERLGIVLEPAD